jgi:hypothetical protein
VTNFFIGEVFVRVARICLLTMQRV